MDTLDRIPFDNAVRRCFLAMLWSRAEIQAKAGQYKGWVIKWNEGFNPIEVDPFILAIWGK